MIEKIIKDRPPMVYYKCPECGKLHSSQGEAIRCMKMDRSPMLEQIKMRLGSAWEYEQNYCGGVSQESRDLAWLLACLDELANAGTALCDGIAGLPPLTAIAGVLTEEYEAMRTAIAKLRE